MKKARLIFMMLLAFAICLVSCDGKKKAQPAEEPIEEEVQAEEATLNLERAINLDKQYMFTTYGEGFRWFESCVTLKYFMDGDTASNEIETIRNVFQVVEQCSPTTADVYVVFCTHNGADTEYEVIKGFWIEDYVLNDEQIAVTFDEAIEKIFETNYPKPHSRQCVLRKEIGTKDANAQYIFGNSHAQLYVDAANGNISDENPAYGAFFGKPLGEWP